MDIAPLFPAPTLILNYVESILPGFHDFMQVNEVFFPEILSLSTHLLSICVSPQYGQ